MIALDNGDKIRGYASAATVVDYTLHGFVGTTVTQLSDGQLASSEGDIYTAGAAVGVASVVLVNTDSAARTVNLLLLPSGGTARKLLPTDVSLEAGYALYFDGVSTVVVSTSGGTVSTGQVSDTAYAASWNGVSTIAPSKNAVYDQMELKAPLISPALVTPALGTPASGTLTNCTGLPTAGLSTQVFAAGIGIGGAAADTGGIAFPATAVPSSDPNTLDDYERGTFDPSVGGNATYTFVDGEYEKVGDWVHIQGVVNLDTIGTGSTSIISGLPFASAASPTNNTGSVSLFYGLASATTMLSIYLAANATSFSFNSLAAAAITSTNGAALLQNGSQVYFAISYPTA